MKDTSEGGRRKISEMRWLRELKEGKKKGGSLHRGSRKSKS
jgi:hypothetical protein